MAGPCTPQAAELKPRVLNKLSELVKNTILLSVQTSVCVSFNSLELLQGVFTRLLTEAECRRKEKTLTEVATTDRVVYGSSADHNLPIICPVKCITLRPR